MALPNYNTRTSAILWAVLVALLVTQTASAEEPRTATVGMPEEIEQLILPGSVLEASPIEDRNQPIVLRIVEAFPHGTAYRYDLVYYGLEPGTFDLKDYLRRRDDSSMDDVPSLPVEIHPVLPPGQIEPTPLTPGAAPRLGGYRNLLLLGGVVWVIGLVIILFAGRKRKSTAWTRTPSGMTLAERLRKSLDKPWKPRSATLILLSDGDTVPAVGMPKRSKKGTFYFFAPIK